MSAPTLASNALTTQQRVQDVLGLKSAEGRSLINLASDYIEKRCGRSFGIASLAETVAGYGTSRIVIARPPIKSITSITFNSTDTVDSTTYTIDDADAGLIQRDGGWRWTAHIMPDISGGHVPGTELKQYTVTYIGGYILPKDSESSASPINGDARDLPYDIEEACLVLIGQMSRMRSRDPSITNESLMSYSSAYSDTPIPSFVERVINAYRFRQ